MLEKNGWENIILVLKATLRSGKNVNPRFCEGWGEYHSLGYLVASSSDGGN